VAACHDAHLTAGASNVRFFVVDLATGKAPPTGAFPATYLCGSCVIIFVFVFVVCVCVRVCVRVCVCVNACVCMYV